MSDPTGTVKNPAVTRHLLGALQPVILAERLQPYQRVFRSQGDGSMYATTISPRRPFQFVIGEVNVPSSQANFIFITDWHVRAFTFSGAAAEDTSELGPGSLTTKVGIDFLLGGDRPFSAAAQITPIPPEFKNETGLEFTNPRTGQTSVYRRARASGFGAATGAGVALLPLTNDKIGSEEGPWSVVVRDGRNVRVALTVFEPLPLPVSFFEVKLAGYYLNQELGLQLLKAANVGP